MAPNADRMCQAIAALLERELAMRVHWIDDVSWYERERMFDAGEIDLCWVCGLPYVDKADRGAEIAACVAPVMEDPRYGGDAVYFSDVVVHAGSHVRAFRDLQGEFGMAILFVTHDLAVAADICDRISVMYAGEMVEMAEVNALFSDPRHPYTRGLLKAMPHASDRNPPLPTIRGNVPRPGSWPAGCRFSNRCDFRMPACEQQIRLVGANRLVRCVRAGELEVERAS